MATMNMRVIQWDEDGHIAGVDNDARGQIILDTHHDKVHDGDAYTAAISQTGVGASGVVLLLKMLNSTKKFHVGFSAFSDDAATIDVYENPTVDLTSTVGVVVSWNNNRVSANSSTLLFYSAPQYTSGSGNNLWTGRIGANNPKTIVGGDTTGNPEWIFQSGTVLVKVVPAGTGKVGVVRAEYYEV